MMKNKKKTAIIGCGAISETHISALQALDISDIVALCDTNAKRLENALKSCPGAVGYSDYKEMLTKSDIDIVHICTPHYLHAEMAIACMERGCDVYLEKPCAINRTLAKDIVHASQICGKKVCVSFQNRLIETTKETKRILESGVLGKPKGIKGIVTWNREGSYYTESGWRGSFEKEGGGVLMNQSIHTLDLMYYFFGAPEFVSGHAMLNKNIRITSVEDTAEAFMRFKNGVTGIFYATNCNIADDSVELCIYCEKGNLLIIDDTLFMTSNGETRIVCKNELLLNGKPYWGNGHKAMIEAFYSAVDGDDSYYCDITDAVQVLDIIAEIYKNSDVKPVFF